MLSHRALPAISLALTALLCACGGDPAHPAQMLQPEPLECQQQSVSDVYTDRIKPLLSQDRPHSCNQCHLSGIELSQFTRATPCETMACLTDKGLVDLKSPEKSLILTWIKRAHPESKLITADVIQEEYDGFLDWIKYSATCNAYECKGATCGSAGSSDFCKSPDAKSTEGALYDHKKDPGDCSDKTLEQLFRDTIYSSRGRCFPCHFTGEKDADPKAPRWVAQDGNCDTASLETMRNVLKLGLVDVKDPAQSLLLLKPENVVMHGGDQKFYDDTDIAEQNFTYWLTRYSKCQKPDSDAGAGDAGMHDAGAHDAGTHDAGTPDAGAPDAATRDAGTH